MGVMYCMVVCRDWLSPLVRKYQYVYLFKTIEGKT